MTLARRGAFGCRTWGAGIHSLVAMIEMTLAGVRIELPGNQPIVLLKEAVGERFLPIWIGQPEAAAIALAQQGVVTPRPMTTISDRHSSLLWSRNRGPVTITADGVPRDPSGFG